MAAVNAVSLTPAQLQGKLQQYYQNTHLTPDEAVNIRDTLKMLIDLGVITGVTVNDVDAQHRAISNPTKISG